MWHRTLFCCMKSLGAIVDFHVDSHVLAKYKDLSDLSIWGPKRDQRVHDWFAHLKVIVYLAIFLLHFVYPDLNSLLISICDLLWTLKVMDIVGHKTNDEQSLTIVVQIGLSTL